MYVCMCVYVYISRVASHFLIFPSLRCAREFGQRVPSKRARPERSAHESVGFRLYALGLRV